MMMQSLQMRFTEARTFIGTSLFTAAAFNDQPITQPACRPWDPRPAFGAGRAREGEASGQAQYAGTVCRNGHRVLEMSG
jgi:hypothetical protein